MSWRLLFKKLFILIVFIGTLYGAGRLYYALTDGFILSNIEAELAYQPQWEMNPLVSSAKQEVQKALAQPFSYLGKGCQSYVFASSDGKYVVKFFKYQRFRPQSWIDLFAFIPSIKDYQKKKAIEKKEKLDKVFSSWKIASEHLLDESGVVYVHLNPSNEWPHLLVIRDKVGIEHEVNLDRTPFMLQRRAVMLCKALDELVAQGHDDQAKLLIDRLLVMLLLEYTRGYADNDHALMQNTGVLDNFPIHIDVGQFVKNPSVRTPKVYQQELYDKTYKFQRWLEQRHLELADHLKARLVAMMGPDYFYKLPYVHKGDVAKLPHVD